MVSMEELLNLMVQRGGSDLHISVGSPPRIRVDGKLIDTEHEPLMPEAAGALLMFDYRCYHRGRANHSGAPRQVGYVLFARRGVHDTHNFAAEYDKLLRDEQASEAAACCEVGSGHTSTPC